MKNEMKLMEYKDVFDLIELPKGLLFMKEKLNRCEKIVKMGQISCFSIVT